MSHSLQMIRPKKTRQKKRRTILRFGKISAELVEKEKWGRKSRGPKSVSKI